MLFYLFVLLLTVLWGGGGKILGGDTMGEVINVKQDDDVTFWCFGNTTRWIKYVETFVWECFETQLTAYRRIRPENG